MCNIFLLDQFALLSDSVAPQLCQRTVRGTTPHKAFYPDTHRSRCSRSSFLAWRPNTALLHRDMMGHSEERDKRSTVIWKDFALSLGRKSATASLAKFVELLYHDLVSPRQTVPLCAGEYVKSESKIRQAMAQWTMRPNKLGNWIHPTHMRTRWPFMANFAEMVVQKWSERRENVAVKICCHQTCHSKREVRSSNDPLLTGHRPFRPSAMFVDPSHRGAFGHVFNDLTADSEGGITRTRALPWYLSIMMMREYDGLFSYHFLFLPAISY
ncbi:uncharacterized protein MYCFIDRAFT_180052 [Pseudocercospora fijiensis CIRAD86]|uniref:Uncharacterized protein n=1 Tax=Pseudocercospora fijiensis (strain CIRAD86) TaxID=383855 RepID=M2ZYI5_PSEFD|nr:uncharacterized protein MYCFIDRAFT_180052 [Pseudocercospora fijiensis CIRAD86]EME77176.1 hypothetical protein MYCFIDRAFT_180052 [Pseudocercospora fijiensis CIRAD86]